MTELSDLLAAYEADRLQEREAKTAVAHAFADHVRNGGTMPHSVVAALMAQREKRRSGDGVQATLRDNKPARNVAGDTNNADDITHSYGPLSGRED